jgi:hypothetical protein
MVSGELQIWRDYSGQFFCNEFCADDDEEARFHSYWKSYRKANELHAPSGRGRLSADLTQLAQIRRSVIDESMP